MEIDNFDPRLFWPGSVIVCGASFTGKTSKVLKWITHIDSVIAGVPEDVKFIWIHGPYQPMFDAYKPRITFLSGWNHPELSPETIENAKHTCYIVDDAYANAPQELLRHMVTAKCHHGSNFLFLLTHHLFSKCLKYGREICLNVSAFVFTYSPSNQSMLRNFAQQYFGKKWRAFMEAVNDVLIGSGEHSRFSYVCINFSARTPDKYRISTFISTPEFPRLYYILND